MSSSSDGTTLQHILSPLRSPHPDWAQLATVATHSQMRPYWLYGLPWPLPSASLDHLPNEPLALIPGSASRETQIKYYIVPRFIYGKRTFEAHPSLCEPFSLSRGDPGQMPSGPALWKEGRY